MLAELMIDPANELSLTELAQRSGVTVPTILRDVDRLVAGGFVRDRRVGRSRLVSINTGHPIYAPLWQVVMYGYGPAAVLPPLLTAVAGVEKAYIYGSWAARYLGEAGEDPRDVDVLVIGKPDSGELYDVAREATRTVGRPVTFSTLSPQRWEGGADGFVQTIHARPLLELSLERP
jgi:DNA-binding transcriptional ArsR family regulator